MAATASTIYKHPASSVSKRFIDYLINSSTSNGQSCQTVQFDTLTQRAVFASDLFFKPEELKEW